jgi:hypothetical protein
MTTAALLLGGAACSVDSDNTIGGSTDGINASASRISTLSMAFCKQYEGCYEEDFDAAYESLGECVELQEDTFGSVNERCADAAMDYLSCYTQLKCDELQDSEEKCAEFVDAYDKECEGETASGTSKSVAQAKALLRKYRIPR